MSTDLSKLLQVNPLFFSLNSVRELVDFYIYYHFNYYILELYLLPLLIFILFVLF